MARKKVRVRRRDLADLVAFDANTPARRPRRRPLFAQFRTDRLRLQVASSHPGRSFVRFLGGAIVHFKGCHPGRISIRNAPSAATWIAHGRSRAAARAAWPAADFVDKPSSWPGNRPVKHSPTSACSHFRRRGLCVRDGGTRTPHLSGRETLCDLCRPPQPQLEADRAQEPLALSDRPARVVARRASIALSSRAGVWCHGRPDAIRYP